MKTSWKAADSKSGCHSAQVHRSALFQGDISALFSKLQIDQIEPQKNKKSARKVTSKPVRKPPTVPALVLLHNWSLWPIAATACCRSDSIVKMFPAFLPAKSFPKLHSPHVDLDVNHDADVTDGVNEDCIGGNYDDGNHDDPDEG